MIGLPFGLLSGLADRLPKCQAVFSSHSNPVQTQAGFDVRRDGSIYRTNGGTTSKVGDFVTTGLPDAVVGDSYEIKVEKVSGVNLDVDAGLGVWIAITSTRSWRLDSTPGQFKNWNGTYHIRDIATPAKIAGPCSLAFDTEDGS